MATPGAVEAKGTGGGTDKMAALKEIYKQLKAEVLEDHAAEIADHESAIQWIDRMVDYNVLGGKCNRLLSVIDTYKILKGVDVLSQEETFLACTLGWCIEWLHAHFLVLDDIMDNSQTRRGQPCWFSVPQVGLIAINDAIILRNHVLRILRRHFKGKPYYADIIDLFNEAEFKVVSGELLDLIITHEGRKDLTRYNETIYRHIAQYKTAYYSFYIPDDYLDCFGDPVFIGKIGTDIEEYKCSWLVVQALKHADVNQTSILFENYGKSDPACVAKVKDLYKELNLELVFREYERELYIKLIANIKAQPNKAVQTLLKSFLHKIYKREK
ncbi:farnesyl pyrophosphate synthase-like isoform X2 [Panicum virgatum]|uniref:Farnesyl pyrophosphate synthase n=1 Tax=Panicum virgatum TaxID=38727 RepID=A0A8T0SND9_PANVG|nr:farnesyl pyrophosphate synthase-like isoform X2 [Panicum virgatum]KAG2600110.1 hypothetical protein PVAP13_5KG495200 [Panicum virgatum]